MAEADRLAHENRKMLNRVNRLLLRRIQEFLSHKLRGHRFRAVTRAEEALEVVGLDAYDLQESPTHIDYSRLRVPPEHLALAILNEDVPVKRFERSVENEFILLLDVSRSMRYPLRRVYGNLPLGGDVPLPDADVEWGKPSLIKMVAGALLNNAIESGFKARIVMFGQGRIDEGELLRGRPSLSTVLFNRLDRHFLRVTRYPEPEEPLLEELVTRLAHRQGVFLLVSDFVDAAFDWDNHAKKLKWFHLLGLLRDWASRRPVLVARVNHQWEVRDPARVPFPVGGQVPNPWWDRCDVQIEADAYTDESDFDKREESVKDAIDRLRRQRAWTAVLHPALRSCCRGFLAVDSTSGLPGLSREIHRMWTRLLER